jgi:hypothetical protein
MLNMAESVSPIPETRSSFNIRELLNTDRVPPLSGIPGIGFRRNYSEFQKQKKWPEIPTNSVSTRFPEFSTGIAYLSQRLIFKHNSMRESEGEK